MLEKQHMPDAPPDPLSRRERQIMDVLYRLGEAPVAAVRDAMADPPSYSSVRAAMGTLVRKGHLQTREDGRAYVYRPVVEPEAARRSALRRVVDNFFGGSPTDAAVALIELSGGVDDATRDRLASLIEQAREEGR